MKKLVLPLLSLMGAAACSAVPLERIHIDGHTREYLLHVPEGMSGIAPVVIALHGGGGDADRMRRLTRFDAMADDEGFFVVFPSALYGNWNDGREGEQLRANAEGVNDVEFIDEVLDRLIVDYPIDQSRIYVTGASDGGIFSLTLACSELGARLAGIAPVMGSFVEGLPEECTPRPLSVQLLNGDEDEFVRTAGGEVYTGGRGRVEALEDTTRFWVEQNGCVTPPTSEQVDAVEEDETSLAIETWTGCERSTEVKRILVEGGGHNWPGAGRGGDLAEGFLGRASKEIDASEAVWDFLSRFERR